MLGEKHGDAGVVVTLVSGALVVDGRHRREFRRSCLRPVFKNGVVVIAVVVGILIDGGCIVDDDRDCICRRRICPSRSSCSRRSRMLLGGVGQSSRSAAPLIRALHAGLKQLRHVFTQIDVVLERRLKQRELLRRAR